MIWSRRQASYQIVQATCLSNPHRKIDENVENITLVIWSRRQASDQIVQATPPEYPHPKTDENGEIMKLKLQFESILGHL